MTTVPTRQGAIALDNTDPLAPFRARYLPQTPDVVAYLDGNSLGRPLASIAHLWSEFISQQWAGRLIRGWSEGWLELPTVVGDELGAAALGAGAGQIVIADSTTVNFYKTVRAAINLRPGRRKLVIDRDNFPTNRYVVESLAKDLDLEVIWLTGTDDGGIGVGDVAAVIDENTALVTLSHIAYHSGYLADMSAITAAAHAVGALVVWDLCHSVGVVPIRLDECEVDFAVGCTYKFLGAGPGSPAFVYANVRHLDHLDQPIWGWLGRRDPFEMEQGYVRAAGIASMISGTPSVLGILAVREGAALVAEAGIGAIRTKSEAMTAMVVDLAERWLIPQGFGIGSPLDPARRGGHVCVTRSDARALCSRLTAAGVIPDFRTPDAIRLGLSPLPLTFVEVWDALEMIKALSAR